MVYHFFLMLHARVVLYSFRLRVKRKHPPEIYLNSLLKVNTWHIIYTKWRRLICVWFPKHKLRVSKHIHSSKLTHKHIDILTAYMHKYSHTHIHSHIYFLHLPRKSCHCGIKRESAHRVRRTVYTARPRRTWRRRAPYISIHVGPRREWRYRAPYISVHVGSTCMEPLPRIIPSTHLKINLTKVSYLCWLL